MGSLTNTESEEKLTENITVDDFGSRFILSDDIIGCQIQLLLLFQFVVRHSGSTYRNYSEEKSSKKLENRTHQSKLEELNPNSKFTLIKVLIS